MWVTRTGVAEYPTLPQQGTIGRENGVSDSEHPRPSEDRRGPLVDDMQPQLHSPPVGRSPGTAAGRGAPCSGKAGTWGPPAEVPGPAGARMAAYSRHSERDGVQPA